jgi:hypothetical protein
MAEPELSESVSWQVALRVWWAMSWRCMGLVIIFIMPVYVLLKPFLRPEVNRLICELLLFPFQVWALRNSLAAKYNSFSITIKNDTAR